MLYGGVDSSSLHLSGDFGTIISKAIANSREHELCDFWDAETDPNKRKLYVFSILLIASKLENPIRDDLYPLCRIYLREDGKLREEEIRDVIKNRARYAAVFQPFIKQIIADTPEGTMIEDIWVEPLKERNPQDPFWSREKHSMGMDKAIDSLANKYEICKRLESDPFTRFTLDSNRDSASVHYGLEP